MRLRWRVRTLMVGVAALAGPLALVAGLGRRSAESWRLAGYHHRAALVLAEEGGSGCMDVPGGDESLYEPTIRRAYLYHRNLARRYSRAAQRPWSPVRAGPEPEWAYPRVLREVLELSESSR